MQLLQTSNQPFAKSALNTVSEQYAFIDSEEIIDKIESASGLKHLGTSWAKLRSNAQRRQGRQKHVMAFGYDQGEGLRLLVTNDHEGRTALRFDLGFFRMACANGIIAGKSVFSQRQIHRGAMDKIDQIVDDAMKHSIMMEQAVRNMQSTETDARARLALRKSIARLRNHDMVDTQVFTARRDEDHGKDLWTQFNVAQEYGIRGGYLYHVLKDGKRDMKKNGEKNVRLAPAVKAIDAQSHINKGLFETAMEIMA